MMESKTGFIVQKWLGRFALQDECGTHTLRALTIVVCNHPQHLSIIPNSVLRILLNWYQHECWVLMWPNKHPKENPMNSSMLQPIIRTHPYKADPIFGNDQGKEKYFESGHALVCINSHRSYHAKLHPLVFGGIQYHLCNYVFCGYAVPQRFDWG